MSHDLIDNILQDDSPMPVGKKHLGVPMIEVPASYLLWFWKENVEKFEAIGGSRLRREDQMVMEYIKDFGVEELEKEAKEG